MTLVPGLIEFPFMISCYHKLPLIPGVVDCLVDGCVNCSNTSSEICEECEDGLTISEDGSNCSLITDAPTTSEDARTTTVVSGMTTGAAQPFITTGRLIGICTGISSVYIDLGLRKKLVGH